MQRIGESRWRPLELCCWPEQGAVPAKGKEYPGLGYKRVRDKPPKAQRSSSSSLLRHIIGSKPTASPSDQPPPVASTPSQTSPSAAPPPPAPVVADNQAAAQLVFVLSPAVFAALCSNATARGAFADDSAAAMAAQLVRSSGSAVSVVGSVPASTCGRRARALLQAGTTMPVNYLITFPSGTNAAAQASQVQSLVTRINTEGVAALGVTSLGPVATSEMTVTGVVVPVVSTGATVPNPADPLESESGVPRATQLGVGIGLGLGGGLIAAGCVAAALALRRRKYQAPMVEILS
ncbi:hypothetical protein QJQ45_021399 [Haematococcus lacustris]|nr:hypothetical protein QJQ45_021399 [Haematococcus lacustris]